LSKAILARLQLLYRENYIFGHFTEKGKTSMMRLSFHLLLLLSLVSVQAWAQAQVDVRIQLGDLAKETAVQ